MASNHTRFDVFLSFRGEDTRHAFTDHLYTALKQAGIATFRDNDEIDRGEDLEPEIIKAIKESKASIVVLSENYAKSRWCLDELLLIIEQRRNSNHFVLPVFYHVVPSDVRNQRQSFTIEVDEGVEGSKWTKYKVDRWKIALAEVANLTGMVVSGSEADFIRKIVDTIDCKLDLKLVSIPSHLTGMDTRAEGINSWLNGESTADVLAEANRTRFDVFLSFRGEDTRHAFIDHLYAALKQAGIATFRDNDEIGGGEDLGPEIVKAIEEAKASIVVLSEKYAKSGWCLDELLLIIEQRRNTNHFVLPVFYHVDPSDVRNQRQSFTIEVDEGVEGSKWTKYKVDRWKIALTEVANLTGMVVSGSEADFIRKIVDTIDCKLDLKLVSIPSHLTGMDTRAEGINAWLNGESTADVLAVCGMGGSGKTTLAQYIYNSNKQKFENSSFLEEIGKHSKQPHGLLGLQNQLLTDILGGKNKMISGVSEGTSKIEKALQRKRVLIVLDDIGEHEELDALLGTKVFHTKSKIIITTRLLDIHAWFESISWRCQMHELKLLNDEESLELLCCHAFGSKIPMEGFKELAEQLAEYCAGNPLALKVLGSSLFVSAEDPLKRNA